jgi:hypothetical protein
VGVRQAAAAVVYLLGEKMCVLQMPMRCFSGRSLGQFTSQRVSAEHINYDQKTIRNVTMATVLQDLPKCY